MALHTGHRQRIKEKFRKDGFLQFADHEILEALLFYTLPYRDTNPTAHALLEAGKTLAGVFRLSEEEVSAISGCTARTREFFETVLSAGRIVANGDTSGNCYSTPASIRAMIRERISCGNKDETWLFLFDNRFRLISVEKIYEGYLASAAFTPSLVAEPALYAHASMVALASTHKNGYAVADPCELDEVNAIARALGTIGISVLEHILVGGNVYIPFSRFVPGSFSENPSPEDTFSEPAMPTDGDSESSTARKECLLLSRLLSYARAPRPELLSEELIRRFGNLATVATEREECLLSAGLSRHAAILLMMIPEVYRRILLSEVPKGLVFDTPSVIFDYLRRLFSGLAQERVFLILLTEDKKHLASVLVAQGSVNSANMNIRSVVETALFRGAKYAIVAHNHPGGTITPSNADNATTRMLVTAFDTVKIPLLAHYIVAGNEVHPIPLGDDEEKE